MIQKPFLVPLLTAKISILKEQCHEEMVVDIIPWISRLGLYNDREPFFPFKNPYSSASIYVKTGSPDLASNSDLIQMGNHCADH
jgi:hypothetical protein